MSKYSHDRNNLDDPNIIKDILTYHHNAYIQKCRNTFPFLPERWLENQENYHEWLLQLEPRELIEKVTRPTLYALNLLLNTNVGLPEDIQNVCEIVFSDEQDETNFEPWRFDKLYEDVQKIDRGESVSVETHSLIMTVCGLLSIWLPAVTRARIYLNRHNSENAFNVVYSDFFLNNAPGCESMKTVINESCTDLIQETINVRKIPNIDRDEIASHMGMAASAAFKAFPDPLDGFVAAASGNVKIKYIQNRGSSRSLPYHIRENLNRLYVIKSLDTTIGTNTKLTRMDLLIGSSQLEVLENQDLMRLYDKEKNNVNLTKRERQAWSMYFDLQHGLENTFKDIGEELDITEEAACQAPGKRSMF